MSKVAHYLQEHLVGEVMTSTDARRYFAGDGSVLQVAPALIVYPRNENDVRKTARFTWQLAERGRIIPLTARGSGTDASGAALGSGIIVVFPAHLNRVLEIDTKANTVTVEPGTNYGKLQQTLHSHGRFIPPYPGGLEYMTIGGAIANNSTGSKTVKYGDTRSYVLSLRVVLANGEVIETRRLSKRELSKKLGLATFEGEIYRSLDTLLEEQHDLVAKLFRNVSVNNAGYDLNSIKHKDGSFDLTPLFVGSQGTLGIITEALLQTEIYNPETTMIMSNFDSYEQVQSAVEELGQMSEGPSAVEMINGDALKQINEINPNQLKGAINSVPKAILLVEFDNADRHLKKIVKKAHKILDKYSTGQETAVDAEQQQRFWKVREAVSTIITHNQGVLTPVSLTDASVPVERLRDYIEGVNNLFKTNAIKPGLWGSIGDGSLSFQISLNLGHVGDRQKAFRFLDEFHKLVNDLGGTISSTAGDGRLRTPYLEKMYGVDQYALLQKVKNIFDPFGTLNPGVKFGTSIDDLKEMIRSDYSLNHLYAHLPRS